MDKEQKITDNEAYNAAKELYHMARELKNSYPQMGVFTYMSNISWKLYHYMYDENKAKHTSSFKYEVKPNKEVSPLQVYIDPNKESKEDEDINQYVDVDLNKIGDANDISDYMFLMK